MSLEQYSHLMLPALEKELKTAVDKVRRPGFEELYAMMAYHLGWEGEGAGPEASGKRIRPLLLLLTTAAAGGKWETALPAAASIELIHNFSLIHDDIEDDSPLRRGRPTIWTKWGIAQALNTGDAMFSLAHLTLLDLERSVSPAVALQAARILQETCLSLTQGQYLDMAYERQDNLTETDYWPMIQGKTAALLGACSDLGALVGGASEKQRLAYRQFGRSLGQAFQVLDDLLGIWGNAVHTGKCVESDLVAGKKSLPVLFGLGKKGRFAQRWMRGSIAANEVAGLAQLLETEGARRYAQEAASRLTDDALQALKEAGPQGEAGLALEELAEMLLRREA
jgi:geranylgeranyl diphosphate synthase, type I